jgi:F-type H+-transporting ATPase subunit delta
MFGSSRDSMRSCSASIDALRLREGFAALTSDLYAVADLLAGHTQLRSALADSGQPVAGREALVSEILGSRVSPLAVEVVSTTVSHRWSSDTDLVIALENLAAQAAFCVAETNGTLDATEEEVFRFGRAVDSSAELQMVLSDPASPSSVRAAVVNDLLANRATIATSTVLGYAMSHLHGRRLDSVIDELCALAAQQRERMVAEVRVAAPLTDTQAQRLQVALSALAGRTVRLNVALDPAVLGGVHVSIGDEVIDGTIASRLEQARRAVLG